MNNGSITLPSGIVLRAIPESPNDDYMAGSDGNIYSRTKYKGFGRKEYVDWYPLTGGRMRKGYKSVSLCHNNIKVTKSVHRLVCSAFHGPPSNKTLQVRHLDGTRDNNIPNNLAWGTQVENWEDRKAHGRGNGGASHPMAKFTDFERKAIRWAIQNELCSQKQAARMLSVSQAAIYGIVNSED